MRKEYEYELLYNSVKSYNYEAIPTILLKYPYWVA